MISRGAEKEDRGLQTHGGPESARPERGMEVSLKNILTAIDLSDCSCEAARYALGIARRYGSTVHLVHVVHSLVRTLAGRETLDQAIDAALRDMRQLEKQLLADGSLAGISHHVFVTEGDIWKALCQIIEQEDIDLLVMGTHGRSGLPKLVLGSIAETALRRASCPVLTVGPCISRLRSSGPEPKTILFPTDLSPQTESAAPYAVLLAQKSAAKLILLHVTHKRVVGASPVTALNQITSHLRELAKREGDDLICCPDPIVRTGSAAETILQVAAECQARPNRSWRSRIPQAGKTLRIARSVQSDFQGRLPSANYSGTTLLVGHSKAKRSFSN